MAVSSCYARVLIQFLCLWLILHFRPLLSKVNSSQEKIVSLIDDARIEILCAVGLFCVRMY